MVAGGLADHRAVPPAAHVADVLRTSTCPYLNARPVTVFEDGPALTTAAQRPIRRPA